MRQTSSEISQMFTGISRRYDLANRILSLGLDRGWRKKLIKSADPQEHDRVLDLATGTADLIVDFAHCPQQLDLVGLDISRGMLEVGLDKTDLNGKRSSSLLIEGDALLLPIESNSIDIISISFGLRNLVDREAGIDEMARVLNSGGRLLILEFSLPTFRPWRSLYLFYLKHLLPRIGGLLTGSLSAYQYLHDSISEFPSPAEIKQMMECSGLSNVEIRPLMGGIAVLYKALKR